MCQLLGMNCNTPTDIVFSFTGFQARGGLTDVHRDGWGIAFFEGRGCRLFIDAKATVDSPLTGLVRSYPIRSTNVIAHIRKATQGAVALENTHPFQREMWGRYWVFAHNGNLKGFAPELDGSFRPVGATDSELAFCWVLQRLRQIVPGGSDDPGELLDPLRRITAEIARHGEFNYLLSNGRALYAHCGTRLAYIERRHPFARAHLNDQDVTVDFSTVTTPYDRVAVIATTPLTDDEIWTSVAGGSLLVFVDGSLAASVSTG